MTPKLGVHRTGRKPRRGPRLSGQSPSSPPSPALVAAFRGAAAANVGDCLGRNLGAVGLRTYHGSLKLNFAGPAITVRVRPGDNLMIHQAIAMAQPGDVIVVDGGGDVS